MKIEATIITDCVPLLEDELAKLNKKAKKLGCNLITYTKTAPYMRAQTVNGANLMDNVVDVIVDGEPIKLNGWRFLGRIEAVPNADNLIFTIPGEKAPEQFRKSSPYQCDHCKQNRVRKATWILEHENGEFKQIGSSCMDDFLGTKSPERAIAWWMKSMDQLIAYLKDLEAKASKQPGVGGSLINAPIMVDALEVLEYACQTVRLRGRYEFGDDHSPSTSSIVWDGVVGSDAWDDLPNDEDKDMAKRIVAFIMARRNGSDYYMNLSIMFTGGRVQARNIRYICTSVYWFLKNQGAMNAKAQVANEFFGVVEPEGKPRQRLRDLKLTVTFVYGVLSRWSENYNYLILMKDADGRTFKWVKTSAGLLSVGDKLVVTGSVIAHEVYKGTRQTVLSRCQLTVVEEKVTA